MGTPSDSAHPGNALYRHGGQIIDASVVPAPKQRNTEEEKAAIKEGRIPDGWKDKPAKLRHKDRDARWTVKYTKAKVKAGADPKAHVRWISPFRCSVTNRTSPSIARTA